VTEPS